MPHLTYEITANLDRPDCDIPGLLRRSNQLLIAQGGVFPTGGIRSRVLWLRDWCAADGSVPDDAFVHARLQVGAGREPEQLKKVGDELFALLCGHFAAHFEQRGLALSMELNEFSESGTWKKNNLHARYKKAQP
ncbi:MAG: 5-carboxymethyl-2-hydroxymuconate Delta-isomerase [Comamonadaceae bacterium]|nr:5-carboxymethyl-2-hydroxymuconate Delta-isomerase [Pseudomonadota bacterium]MBS0608527.1 5-carboxymethyl-2-hydroxymuconate Delta-isomerase [Pseudomonadota bacterium]MDE2413640.1 5-carboxymethyl-2-hydroxymuconate Delta-isomerase [Comamonadaceae bacterium]